MATTATFIGSAFGGAGSSGLGVVTTAAVPAGALVVVMAAWTDGTGILPTGVSDNGAGLTYTQGQYDFSSAFDGAQGTATYTAPAPSGLASGTTITFSVSPNPGWGLNVHVVYLTGVDTSASPVRSSGTDFEGGGLTAWFTPSGAATAGDAILAIGWGDGGASGSTPGSGLTELSEMFDTGNNWVSTVVYQEAPSTTTFSASGTWNTSTSFGSAATIVVIKAAAGGGGGTPGNTGEKFPTSGTTASESPWLDNDWTSPGSITANDGTYASVTASTFDSGDQTFVLKAKGFDFSSIPAGATINGVTVRVEAHADSTSVGIDLVQLLDTSGAKVGTNKSDTTQRLTTADAVYTWGGSTDLWGNALTLAWVQDPDFGVAIGGHAYTANSQIFVDYVTVEIDYTTSGASVSVTGKGSAAAFGAITPRPGGVSVAVTGKSTASALGAVGIAVGGVTRAVTGQGSAAAFGSVGTNVTFRVSVTGKGSAAQFGSVSALPGGVTRPITGKGSAAAFGAVSPHPGAVSVSVTGKGSAASFGGVGTHATVTVTISGRGSAAAFGSALALAGNITVPVAGRVSAASFGAFKENIRFFIAGLGSAAAFGSVSASTTGGALNVGVPGKDSVAAFGSVSPAEGGVTVPVTGKGSAAAFSTAPAVNQRFALAGCGSAGAFGTLTIAVGNVDLAIGGLGSAAQFGAVTIAGGIAPTFNPAVQGGDHRHRR